jgi:hypothetical protein
MQLGFNAVKSICLSASLIDELLKGPRRDRILLEMSRAFHAATQARTLAVAKEIPATEEVFVAALLYRIGHIAFWTFGGKKADELEQEIQSNPSIPVEQMEKNVLGFTLDQLSSKLASEWQLGDVLADALSSADTSNPLMRSILLGHLLATEASSGRWGTERFDKVVAGVSKFLGISLDAAGEMISAGAGEALNMAEQYGFKEYIRLTPVDDTGEERLQVDDSAPPSYPDPDHLLQLEVLGELDLLRRESQINLNVFLATLMEGMSRGMGMDRILLGIVSPDRTVIQGRYGLGWEQTAIENFTFDPSPSSKNIFSKVMLEKGCVWVKGANMKFYITPEVRTKMACSEFFVGALETKSRVIGTICADRALSSRELNEDDFNSFRFFVKAANAVLTSKL